MLNSKVIVKSCVDPDNFCSGHLQAWVGQCKANAGQRASNLASLKIPLTEQPKNFSTIWHGGKDGERGSI